MGMVRVSVLPVVFDGFRALMGAGRSLLREL
jgi:hypothetical protein